MTGQEGMSGVLGHERATSRDCVDQALSAQGSDSTGSCGLGHVELRGQVNRPRYPLPGFVLPGKDPPPDLRGYLWPVRSCPIDLHLVRVRPNPPLRYRGNEVVR